MDLLQPVTNFLSSTFMWSSSRHYWLYMVAYIVIALILYMNVKTDRGSFFSFLFPRDIYTHPSVVMDLKIWFVLTLVLGIGFFPLIFAIVSMVSAALNELLNLLGPAWEANRTTEPPGFMDRLLFTVIATACMDFGFFFMHYLQHKISWLWVFHKVHHSAEVLTPATANRHHPVDYMLEGCSAFLISGIGIVLFTRIHGTEVDRLTIINVSALHFFYYMTANLRHSHLWLSFGPLSKLFISPSMHQIHHSIAPQHFNKNFGFNFSIWDWIFRTRYIPQEREQLTFGLHNGETGYNGIVDAVVRPFKESIAQFRQRSTWRRVA